MKRIAAYVGICATFLTLTGPVCAQPTTAHPLNMITSQDAIASTLVRDKRTLVTLPSGTELVLWGTRYRATRDATAYLTLSSEFIGVAIVSGTVNAEGMRARAGEIFVTPIESDRTQRYLFDAEMLSRTLSASDRSRVAPLMQPLIAHQRRMRFFGRLETVDVNIRAPGSGLIEAVRSPYLGHGVIVDIRKRARGDGPTRHRLTAERFAQAMTSRDIATIAALIDPKPFTDVNRDPTQWQAARTAFAMRMLAASPASGAIKVLPEPLTFEFADTFTLRLVDRDRATFVAAMEPKP